MITTGDVNLATATGRPIRYLLLFNIQLSVLPLYIQFPPVVILLLLLLTAWQYFSIRNGWNNPGKPVQTLIVMTVFVSLFFIYGHLIGQQPGITLITLMTLLKTFEINSRRDCYVVIYSCFFIIAANFFQGQSVWLMLYVFVIIIVLTSSMIKLSDRRNTLNNIDSLKLATRYSVFALPLMLILFVLFPRIPGPLWALPEDAHSGHTGLTEEMSPGSINQLISSSAIALRVKFKNAIPPRSERYWRGAVLELYDGRTWRRDRLASEASANIIYQREEQNNYSYTVTLEPTRLDWLLSLEYPQTFDSKYEFSREAMLLSDKKITNVISYTINSQTAADNRSLFETESYKNRLLPVGLNPKAVELAQQLMRESSHNRQRYIENVLNTFRQGGFSYTLNPDLLGENAIDDFMFNSKRGFCEHYASAFSFMMRAAGIPARVIIGYQGGQMNPLDDYMIIRQSDAHAWTEVWLDYHWVRIDPTAVVSPERITQGIQDAGLEINRLPMLLISDSDLLKNAAFLYDSFQNNWNQWVIGFDQEKQKSLLKFLGFDDATVSDLILLLVSAMSITGLAIAVMVLKQTQKEKDEVQRYYQQLCNKIQRAGLQRRLNEGPVDFERRVYDALKLTKQEKDKLRFIFKAYRSLRYGEQRSGSLLRSYIKKIRALRLPA